ncbi:mycothiol synthase [Glycomyces sp. L485]|uniref:mycothiol synthase n=1 Tax=Glycomyces sp. L485 TaxID=2909235 RepID=UPI001F4A62C9|nr:mycothiol synthase [Glycomyces sp. L485]MCH7229419.1 mycothiol synthase [Glycomyces sp. L485]
MPQHSSLSGRDVHKIVTLALRCVEVDDIEPFNEQTTLALHRPPSPEFRHFIAPHDETIIGYAGVEIVGEAAGVELAVDPDHRRRGVGRALLREVVASLEAEITSLKVWAHGDLPAATALATSEGFIRDRVLFKLSRDLEGFEWPSSWPSSTAGNWPRGTGPAVSLPAGVSLRDFEVGEDEDEWLRVNAAAFAHHPEQGRWTIEDLRARQEETWFDPEGLLVAEDADGLLGFHWTKIEGGVGEIYVLGVDPRAQGTGLGKTLTLAGLAHLATHGIHQVELYTDESNARAVELYRSQGFGIARSDVQWAKRLG